MQQSHSSPRNPEAIDVWWCVMIIPFRTPQFSSFYNETYKLQLKFKQASKEFQKEFHHEKIQARLAKMFFMFFNLLMFLSQKHQIWQQVNIIERVLLGTPPQALMSLAQNDMTNLFYLKLQRSYILLSDLGSKRNSVIEADMTLLHLGQQHH